MCVCVFSLCKLILYHIQDSRLFADWAVNEPPLLQTQEEITEVLLKFADGFEKCLDKHTKRIR